MGARMRGLQCHDLGPLICSIFSRGLWGTDHSSQVLIGAEVATGEGCHCSEPSGAQALGKAWCVYAYVCAWVGGGLES